MVRADFEKPQASTGTIVRVDGNFIAFHGDGVSTIRRSLVKIVGLIPSIFFQK